MIDHHILFSELKRVAGMNHHRSPRMMSGNASTFKHQNETVKAH